MILNEMRIKHQQQRDINRKLKHKYIESIRNSRYTRLWIRDKTTNNCETEVWKIIENNILLKKKYIIGQTCVKCGDYIYKNNDVYEKYPLQILCKCT